MLAGRSGRSISLVTQYDVEVVQRIEALIGKQLEEFALEEEDVLEYFKETLVAKRKARMVSGLNYIRTPLPGRNSFLSSRACCIACV